MKSLWVSRKLGACQPLSMPGDFDPQKIQRVLINLLSNACKFTPMNGSINCLLVGSDVTAKIIVADSGPGIPLNLREAIFERFFQASGAANRRIAGSGLGLSIAKDFVELHRGKLSVESSPAGGAAFIVELPLKAPADVNVQSGLHQINKISANWLPEMPSDTPIEDDDDESTEMQVLNEMEIDKSDWPLILVVEDSIELNNYIAEVLSYAYRVESAFDGQEAFDKAITTNPDLILVDIMIPKMDGVLLVREMKSHPDLRAVPIIVLTANTDRELSEKMLMDGVQDYFFKPFSPVGLKIRIANLIKLKKSRDMLEQKYTELVAANKELDTFSYAVSHNIRNPLQAIVGFSGLVLDDESLDPEIKEYLSSVLASANKIEELMDNLFVLSTAVRSEIHHTSVDLSALIKGIVQVQKRRNPAREVDVIVHENITAMCDARLMKLVLEDLFKNAWNLTEKSGQARIEFGVSNDANQSPEYFLRDNGVGFSKEDIDRLFIPFSHFAAKKDFPSIGIGFIAAKRIIERHGGSIRVESTVGEGTTFYISLPILPIQANNFLSRIKMLESSESAVSEGALILVVEDSVEMNNYICEILSGHYKTVSAFNGNDGLNKAITLKPDLILIDLMMPEMNGIELVGEIRKQDELFSIPIMILTAKAEEEMGSKLFSEGVQDYVIKPFSSVGLRARVGNLVRLKKARDAIEKENKELITANQELDTFTAAVSHELRNPLQAIVGFSSLALDHHALDPQSAENINHVLQSARKIESLINDLLLLSHAIHGQVKLERVNLSAIVAELAGLQKQTDSGRVVDFSIQDSVEAVTDKRLVRIIFENLIENAWKFTAGSAHAQIEFGVIDKRVPVYFIRDNGIGFAITEQDKLFVPFSRLQAAKDIPGTGLGLAMIKQIIERLGGRIWVESEVDRGAKFLLTLSKSDQCIDSEHM